MVYICGIRDICVLCMVCVLNGVSVVGICGIHCVECVVCGEYWVHKLYMCINVFK